MTRNELMNLIAFLPATLPNELTDNFVQAWWLGLESVGLGLRGASAAK